MREEAKRCQELAGKGQANLGFAAKQETATTRSTVTEGKNAGRRHYPKDQNQHVYREITGAFPFGSHWIAGCCSQQCGAHRTAGRPHDRNQSAM